MSQINNHDQLVKPKLRLLGKRTKAVESRIRNLLRRNKPFYLTTVSIEDGKTIEEWFVSSGGWVYISDPLTGIYKDALGHIKNCLLFLNGNNPIWYDPERPVKRSYVRRNVQRGTGF